MAEVSWSHVQVSMELCVQDLSMIDRA